jgi:hypothetical protein
MDTKVISEPPPETHISRTTRIIAFALLALYALALLLIGIVAAAKKDPESSQIWFDLFKSGFLIMGGGLTTVIGYYFGSQGIQEAEARVATAQQELDQARAEMEKQRLKIEEFTEMQAPTFEEDSLTKEEPLTGTMEED